jgi:MarR family transcriptional repressor of emrRAB
MSFDAIAVIEKSVITIGRRYPGFPTELSIVLRLIKLLSWQMANTGNALLKTWGISFTEYNALTLLYGHGRKAMSATEISDVIGEPANATKRMIQSLQARGLIARGCDESDRRKVLGTLTDAGAQLVHEVLPVLCGLVNDFVRSFGAGEMAEFSQALKQWVIGVSTWGPTSGGCEGCAIPCGAMVLGTNPVPWGDEPTPSPFGAPSCSPSAAAEPLAARGGSPACICHPG